VKALCWEGVNELSVEDVPEPKLLMARDAIVRVGLSSVCGSDLHLLDGYVPTMREGDVIGHEFMGEVVEVGPAVSRLKPGDRVVVGSILGCGQCRFCREGAFSLCDNTNPHPAVQERVYGHATAGIFGYSHAFGGLPGSHAEYIRVPFADVNAVPVPEGISDEQAVFASDAVPTGWMAAEMCGIQPGDVVAVWGSGGVGLMAMHAAYLLGASDVIAIDRLPERLALAEQKAGAIPLDYEQVDVAEVLADLTGGRGPDRCIEAVGMESHGQGIHGAYDKVKQALRLQTDRSVSLRQAIHACRKGGTVSIVGVFGGVLDKFPLGAAMNKGLTMRMGQQHAASYIPMLLDRIALGEIDPSYLLTDPMPLSEGPDGYDRFKNKRDGCVRAVFRPGG
jgi:threonine dehydrogenase-like Zn-dependent dehydrogenase